MANESESRAGRYEVDIEEVEYLRHGDKSLLARVFKPRGKGPFHAVVEMHGGAWRMGSSNNNDPIILPVASGGVVIAALDFRVPPASAYPGSVADVNYAVRWLKANAARFNTRPEWVGAMRYIERGAPGRALGHEAPGLSLCRDSI